MARSHGTRSCYVNGCRQPECCEANREYMREMYRLRLAVKKRIPKKVDLVDPGPSHRRVAELRAAGMGCPSIAAAAGLRRETVREIANGTRQFVTRDTERRVLSVELHTQWVDVTGTARRIRAMARLGHSLATISADTGIAPRHLSDITSGHVQKVRRTTYDAVLRAYRTRSMRVGESEQARARSEAKAWPSALAWDEDDLDNPDSTPVGVATPSDEDLDLDDWEHLIRGGESPARAAQRCGVKLAAVERAAYRAGRRDLAGIAATARNQERATA